MEYQFKQLPENTQLQHWKHRYSFKLVKLLQVFNLTNVTDKM